MNNIKYLRYNTLFHNVAKANFLKKINLLKIVLDVKFYTTFGHLILVKKVGHFPRNISCKEMELFVSVSILVKKQASCKNHMHLLRACARDNLSKHFETTIVFISSLETFQMCYT